MFKIKTMNTISEHGTGALEKRGCLVGPDVEHNDLFENLRPLVQDED